MYRVNSWCYLGCRKYYLDQEYIGRFGCTDKSYDRIFCALHSQNRCFDRATFFIIDRVIRVNSEAKHGKGG
jgi:hypothetical protein